MQKKIENKEERESDKIKKPLSNFWIQEGIRISQEQRKRHEEMGAMHKYDRWKYDKNNS